MYSILRSHHEIKTFQADLQPVSNYGNHIIYPKKKILLEKFGIDYFLESDTIFLVAVMGRKTAFCFWMLNFAQAFRKHSSAGMSVRLTRERSGVRASLLPCDLRRDIV